jgi:hypothetical protein
MNAQPWAGIVAQMPDRKPRSGEHGQQARRGRRNDRAKRNAVHGADTVSVATQAQVFQYGGNPGGSGVYLPRLDLPAGEDAPAGEQAVVCVCVSDVYAENVHDDE